MAGKYRLSTLGCKVNQYESQQIRELLESHGLRPALPSQSADIAVINTCAVTAAALRKSRQAIRRLARDGTPVVVVGCGASADGEILGRIPGVIATIDHASDRIAQLKSCIIESLKNTPSRSTSETLPHSRTRPQAPTAQRNELCMSPHDPDKNPREQLSNAGTYNIVAPTLPIVNTEISKIGRIERFCGHQRAFLKVQDGCDAHCTYCIIPRLRPRLAWKPVAAAVDEARSLVAAGHKEIIVTGIFLGAYGRETAVRKRFDRSRSPLAELVAALAGVDGLERLRLSSLEPGDVDEALLEVLGTHQNCVPHLHLPLQSGSAEILRRMNRQYGRDAFRRMIDRVKDALNRPAISTDIIAGFPGESDADFEATVEMAKEVEFVKIHAFPFSSREGTAAARWKSQFVHPTAIRWRMDRLAEIGRECSLAVRRRAIGLVERVLVESHGHGSDADPANPRIAHGRTDRYFAVHFDAPSTVKPGDLAAVRVDRVTPTRTHGTYLPLQGSDLPLSVISH
ncbi:MAG: MiaB/RimO family radical SAM methylthiotransferase [Planctomycetes bacterium]|nr:MiaB/RimO family radical SAM methylthiotransferase [Planctomycetota bacterium]